MAIADHIVDAIVDWADWVGDLDLLGVTGEEFAWMLERAEGRVRALLTGDVAGQRIPTTMSGTPRCDGTALLLPLTSPAGEGSTIRIWRDGRYRTDLTLATSDPTQVARLQGFGFVQTPQGMQLAIEGRF